MQSFWVDHRSVIQISNVLLNVNVSFPMIRISRQNFASSDDNHCI